MRIHIHTLSYPPKRLIGSELYDHQLALALQASGHDVSIFAFDYRDGDEEWDYDGIRVNPKLITKPDLIITHVDLRQKAVLFWKQHFKDTPRPPLVGIIHNESSKTLGEASFYIWDALISNSTWIEQEVEIKKTNNSWVLIPPTPQPVQQSKTKPNFIFQVNFGKSKGGTDVFKMLAKELPNENFLAGTGGWGEQNHSQFTGLENVQILDHQPLNADFWKHVRVLLLPSILESWSMIASESIAHGTPVITYNNLPGVRENLGDAAIYLSPKASREEWVQAVKDAKKIKKATILHQAQKNYERHRQELAAVVQQLATHFGVE